MDALNDMIQQKIVDYSSQGDSDGAILGDSHTIKIGDVIQLNFHPDLEFDMKNPKFEKEIVEKFQLVDSTVDHCERVIGHWQPENKFMSVIESLDELVD